MKTILRVLPVLTSLVVAVPAIADEKADQASPDKGTKKEKPVALEFAASFLGVGDTNLQEKPEGGDAAGGGDAELELEIAVPLAKQLSWVNDFGFGTNYRASTGDIGANGLKLEGSVKTGLDALVVGTGSVKGREVKKSTYPALRLGADAKYEITSQPLIEMKNADVTEDALEMDDDDDSDEVVDEGDEEGADSGAGGQSFTNPATQHKVAGNARVTITPIKALDFTLQGGAFRDFAETPLEGPSNDYTAATGGLNAKQKISDKYFWLSEGYSIEGRFYDEKLGADDQPMQLLTHGIKAAIEVPLKAVKFKLEYALKYKVDETNEEATRTRHQGQLVIEVPVAKVLSLVADGRLSNTVAPTGPDALRFIGLAGLKLKLK